MLSLLAAAALCQLPSTDRTGATAALGSEGAWFVDESANAVLRLAGDSVEKVADCAWPSQLVADATGTAWASCRQSGEVLRLKPGEPSASFRLGDEPRALALDAAARRLYVGLVTTRAVVMIDADTGETVARIPLDSEPIALGLYPGGLAVASRRSSALDIYPRDLVGPPRSLSLALPAYRALGKVQVGGELLAAAGDALVVVAAVAEVGEPSQPTYYEGSGGAPVTHDVFVLRPGAQPKRLGNLVLPDVAGVAWLPGDDTMLFASRGLGRVVAASAGWQTFGNVLREPLTGLLGVVDDGRMTIVMNDAQRAITRVAWDLGRKNLSGEALWADINLNASSPETLALAGTPADVELARGRQLFHQADDRRLSQQPLSCSGCHREGRDDGRTWLGQGFMRQTPMLAGREIAATGPYGWNGEYERLEQYIDFTIKTRMQGTGLAPADLKALARYVSEGLRPVAPPAVAVTSDAATRGRSLFESGAVGCASCHPADGAFTDGTTHDLKSVSPAEKLAWGTLHRFDPKPTLGLKAAPRPGVSGVGPAAALGGVFGLKTNAMPPMPAMPAKFSRIDTPSLLRVGMTAPYLHDGSAQTLDEVFTRLGDHMGGVSALSVTERADLVAYLQTL